MKRGTAMPQLQMKVLRKPVQTDVVIAAHAIRVRTTMPSFLFAIKNFSGFHLQELSITLLKIQNHRQSTLRLPQIYRNFLKSDKHRPFLSYFNYQKHLSKVSDASNKLIININP
jgi:hypothetical protein